MKWFQNLKTRTKLISSFAVVGVVTLGVGAMGIRATAQQNAYLDLTNEKHLAGTRAVFTAEMNRLDVERGVREMILVSDPAVRRAELANINACIKDMESAIASTGKTVLNPTEQAQLKILQDDFSGWADRSRQAAEQAQQGHADAALALVRQNEAATGRMNDAVDVIVKDKAEASDLAAKAGDDNYTSTRNGLVLLLLLGAMAAFGLGAFIAGMIARPLQQAKDVLAGVADGDFTRHLDIDARDEIGQLAKSLNAAVDSVRNALRTVTESANVVTTASGELSSAAQAIASGAQKQASSLEETAASLVEMTSVVKQNADNAQQAAQLAAGARDVAEKGGKVVTEAVGAMTEINASSRRIADIITAIDEIAFQTNLLALNAAVEAARAGEQGRGFAVVATEVRNLAQRSASAAKEIKGLINDSVEKVESGSKLVNQSGTTLEEIVTSVKRVTDIVSEIAASSREQSAGIGQVNAAVSQMDLVTQSNAAQTEELASTAEGLSDQARALMAQVQRFNLGDSGHTVSPVSTPSAKPKAKVLPMLKAGVHQVHMASPASAPVASRAATGTDGFEEF